MLRWAVSGGDLDHNPIDGMKGPAQPKPRTRVLTNDEIRELWNRLPGVPDGVAQAIKFCLATGQRIGEVTGLTRGELELQNGTWNIPGSRTKNGHSHSVPLSPLALSIINGKPTGFGVSTTYVGEIIRNQLQNGQRWTAHDLRRTALTKMAELGVAPIVLGHIAKHRTTTKAGITLGVYVQHQYEKEKREALELWADTLQGIVDGGASKVVAIHATR